MYKEVVKIDIGIDKLGYGRRVQYICLCMQWLRCNNSTVLLYT